MRERPNVDESRISSGLAWCATCNIPRSFPDLRKASSSDAAESGWPKCNPVFPALIPGGHERSLGLGLGIDGRAWELCSSRVFIRIAGGLAPSFQEYVQGQEGKWNMKT